MSAASSKQWQQLNKLFEVAEPLTEGEGAGTTGMANHKKDTSADSTSSHDGAESRLEADDRASSPLTASALAATEHNLHAVSNSSAATDSAVSLSLSFKCICGEAFSKKEALHSHTTRCTAWFNQHVGKMHAESRTRMYITTNGVTTLRDIGAQARIPPRIILELNIARFPALNQSSKLMKGTNILLPMDGSDRAVSARTEPESNPAEAADQEPKPEKRRSSHPAWSYTYVSEYDDDDDDDDDDNNNDGDEGRSDDGDGDGDGDGETLRSRRVRMFCGCGKAFNSQQSFNSHQHNCAESLSCKGGACGKSFSSDAALIEHEATCRHIFRCRCGKTHGVLKLHNAHMRICTFKGKSRIPPGVLQGWICACKDMFETAEALHQHKLRCPTVRSQKGSRPFPSGTSAANGTFLSDSESGSDGDDDADEDEDADDDDDGSSANTEHKPKLPASPTRRMQMFSLRGSSYENTPAHTPPHSGAEDEGSSNHSGGARGGAGKRSSSSLRGEIFECEFDCKFENRSERLVEIHELSCPRNPHRVDLMFDRITEEEPAEETEDEGEETEDEEARELQLLHEASLNPYTVHVLNGGTGEVKTFASATLASHYLNCYEYEIYRHLRTGDPIKGFVITRRPIVEGSVELRNESTNETLVFQFIKDVENFLGCTSERLVTCMRKGTPVNAWKLARARGAALAECSGPLHFRLVHRRAKEVKVFATLDKAAKFIRCTAERAEEYMRSGASTKKGWHIGRCNPPERVEHIYAVFPKRNRVDAYACACGKRYAKLQQLSGHRASCFEEFVCRGRGCDHIEETLSDMRAHETSCGILMHGLGSAGGSGSERSNSASPVTLSATGSASGGPGFIRSGAASSNARPHSPLVPSPLARSATASPAAADGGQDRHQAEHPSRKKRRKLPQHAARKQQQQQQPRVEASHVGLDVNTLAAAAYGIETGNYRMYKELVVRQVKRKWHELKIEADAQRVAAIIANSEEREWSRLRGVKVMLLVTHSFRGRTKDELSVDAQSLVSFISADEIGWAKVQLEAKPMLRDGRKGSSTATPYNYRIRGDNGKSMVGLIPWSYMKDIDVEFESAQRRQKLAKHWPEWSGHGGAHLKSSRAEATPVELAAAKAEVDKFNRRAKKRGRRGKEIEKARVMREAKSSKSSKSSGAHGGRRGDTDGMSSVRRSLNDGSASVQKKEAKRMGKRGKEGQKKIASVASSAAVESTGRSWREASVQSLRPPPPTPMDDEGMVGRGGKFEGRQLSEEELQAYGFGKAPQLVEGGGGSSECAQVNSAFANSRPSYNDAVNFNAYYCKENVGDYDAQTQTQEIVIELATKHGLAAEQALTKLKGGGDTLCSAV